MESLCGVTRIYVLHPNSAENMQHHCAEWPGFIVSHSSSAVKIRHHWVEWSGFIFPIQIELKTYGITVGVIRNHLFHPNLADNIRHHCVEWSGFMFSFKFSHTCTESLCGVIRIHIFHPLSWKHENLRNHRAEWSGFTFIFQIKLKIYGVTVCSDQYPRFSSKFSWKHTTSPCGVIKSHVFSFKFSCKYTNPLNGVIRIHIYHDSQPYVGRRKVCRSVP